MPAVSPPVAVNFAQSLALGQSVYFVVSASLEYTYDSTGLKLSVDDAAVPEPSSLALAVLGALALAAYRRLVL